MSWQCKNLPASRWYLLLLATAVLPLAWTADAAAQQPTARDAFGDPLPDGAVSRLGSIRWRHAGQATFAAFLPDGKTVISAGVDKTIRVWEYPAGKELRRIGTPAPIGPVKGGPTAAFGTPFPIALSKDGKTLAACFDFNNILLFDVASGKELQSLKAASGPASGNRRIQSLAFAPDGTNLGAFRLDGSGRVWDWAKDKDVSAFGTPVGSAAVRTDTVAWSPDGKALAILKEDFDNDDQTIELWNLTTGKKLQTVKLDAEEGFILGLIFTPDSTTLAMAADIGQITLMDVATGKKIRSWSHGRGSAMLLFSPDGSKLYGRDRGIRMASPATVVEWDVADGKPLRKFTVSASAPDFGRGIVVGFQTAWSPDGRVFVMSGGGNAPQFVDVPAGKEIGPGAAPLTSAHFTPDGKHVWSRTGNGDVQKWEASTGKRLDLPALAKLVLHGPSSPDGNLLVSSSATDAKRCAFLDAATSAELGSFPVAMPKAPKKANLDPRLNLAMLFSPDSRMVAVRQVPDKKIILYEAPTGKLLRTLAIDPVVSAEGRPFAIAPPCAFFSPDGKTLAAFADTTTFAVWNAVTGERMGELTPPNPNLVHSGAFSRDGRCIVLDLRDGTAVLYELATGRVRRTYGQAPLGRQVFRAGNIPLVPATRVAFGRSGQTLFQAGLDRAIHVWDVDSGKERTAFKGHLDSVDAIALSDDGKTLVSAGADTTALLWDLTRVKRPVPAVKPLTQSECSARWQTLLDNDAAKAFAAICNLSAAPKEALELIQVQVKPAAPLDMQRVEELVGALESSQFNTREQAKAELIKIGERVVPAIDRVLAGNLPLENKRRLAELREQAGGIVLKGERLRMYRAVEILERIGTAEARRLLQSLADGAPGALVTTTAQVTLQRLEQKK